MAASAARRACARLADGRFGAPLPDKFHHLRGR
jgi:hypothetical protein